MHIRYSDTVLVQKLPSEIFLIFSMAANFKVCRLGLKLSTAWPSVFVYEPSELL